MTLLYLYIHDCYLLHSLSYMSRVKENGLSVYAKTKGADQLCGTLCLCYIDCTSPLHSKCKISSLQPSFLAVQPGLSALVGNP